MGEYEISVAKYWGWIDLDKLFVLPGVYLFGLSFPMEYVLRRVMPPVEEESEEAQKWYHQ